MRLGACTFWIRLATVVGLGLAVAVAVSGLQYAFTRIVQDYSPGFRSENADAAERAGVLVLRPTLADSVDPLGTGDIEVVDV